jgi:outer membrane protein assembly factor BamB
MGLRSVAVLGLALFAKAIFAAEIEEPELLWRQVLGGAALTKPAAQAGSVALVCDGGQVKAFGANGRLLWEYRAGGRLLPFITRSDGGAYICRTNGIFSALNRSGRRLWQVNLRESPVAPPLVGWDGRVFVFLPARILCFTASGTRLWTLDLEKPITLAPVPDKAGGFAAVLADGSLLLVNAFGVTDAVQLQSVPFAVMPLPTLASGKGALYGQEFAAIYADGRLDVAGGTKGQDAGNLPSALAAAPVAAAERGGSIAVLLADGGLTLVSREQGVLWTVKTLIQDTRVGGPYIDWNERGICLFTQYGGEAYNLNGERLWNLRLTGAAAAPVLDEDGILYSGGSDWVLYAYRVDARLPAQISAVPAVYGLGLPPPGAISYASAPDVRDFLLDTVEDGIRRGGIGRFEPEYTALLFGIASDRAENHEARVRALRLLGTIGSREAVPFLTVLFRREQDAVVRGAAAEAIGAIGVDPKGRALAAFEEAVGARDAPLQERLLWSVILATGKLCRFSGPPLSERGVRLLANLSVPTQPASVRRRATSELSALYKK